MTKLKFVVALLLMSSVAFLSCEKDDPEIPNEEEIITTLRYTLTPDGGGAPVVFSFQDLDGDGGNAPSINVGILSENTTYTGVLELLNEQELPAESITAEIEEEAEDHQFFFQSNLPGLNIRYDDSDANGNPIGLNTNVNTTNAGKGTLTIILRHEPDKTATGVSDGNIANAGGETDIEVTFEVNVQ